MIYRSFRANAHAGMGVSPKDVRTEPSKEIAAPALRLVRNDSEYEKEYAYAFYL